MKFVLMDAATGDGGGAAGGGAGDGGAAAAAAAGAAGGEGGAAAGGQEGAGGQSALSAGGAPEWKLESVPEKFHVKKDDGTFDVEAMLRKTEESRAELEKRMGAGGIRPKDPAEYKLPDMPEALKDVKLETADFAKKAHDLGLSQEQYAGVMAEYLNLLPNLVQGQAQAQSQEVVAQLNELWGESAKANFAGAFTVANRVAEKMGVPFSEVEAAVGNNPMALRILASFADEVSEDKTPAAANNALPAGFSIEAAITSEAYTNSAHPEHKKVTDQVNAWYAKNPNGIK
ncbi:hypothetical protein CEJ45_08455 [Herbaspirillum aquaticum]|uniref:Uncharacterized protein n=2 Tax=Herbaspirillum aquaticum TaxID=568783 RepID=A0A225SWH9_9BURK|nr:hypothetical protein CEJ45_08455 [Herbaspirillum aquaticum]